MYIHVIMLDIPKNTEFQLEEPAPSGFAALSTNGLWMGGAGRGYITTGPINRRNANNL